MLVLTDRHPARYPLPEVVAGAVAGGARWIVLREKDLPRDERLALAEELRAILAPAGGRLIVAGPDRLGGAAVHLAADDPLPTSSAVDGSGGQSYVDGGSELSAMDGSLVDGVTTAPCRMLIGRSCHTGDELARLSIEDYATLSPVYASTSKPGYGPALGPELFGRLAAGTPRPVLALGGVETPDRVAACVAAGAAGVAVMGAVMRAADPRATVSALLEEVAP